MKKQAEFRILKAARHDHETIHELIRREFPYFNINAEELMERLCREEITMFTAKSRKKIAGFIELEFLEGNMARINGLTVTKEYRGKSAAKKLLAKAINYLKQNEVEKVILLVKQSNQTAKNLYRQFGFEFSGYYHKKLDHDIVEQMQLMFAQEEKEAA